MLDWLPILATASALLGAMAAGAPNTAPAAIQRLAAWTVTSVILATVIARLVALAIPPDHSATYSPLLAGLVGALLATVSHHFSYRTVDATAMEDARRLLPLVGLLAGGASWLCLAPENSLISMIGHGLILAGACGIGVFAGAALRGRLASSAVHIGTLPRLTLSLCVALLALCALSTVG